jgi:hypothetical protein
MKKSLNTSKEQLGLRELIAMGVGGMIGGGIFSVMGLAVGIAGHRRNYRVDRGRRLHWHARSVRIYVWRLRFRNPCLLRAAFYPPELRALMNLFR